MKRYLHGSVRLGKEDSVVEKSVKALKGEVEGKKLTEAEKAAGLKEKSFLQRQKAKWSATLEEMRKTGYLRYFWNAFKNFILHYKDGFVLFWKNFKYCVPLLLKYVRNGRSSLKRREYKMVSH